MANKVVILLTGALFAIFLAACSGGGGGGGGSPATGATPLLAAQPQSIRVGDGQPATFSVSAVSATTVSYQWSRNGAAIPGATSASYSIAAAQLSDDRATFTVTVSNTSGVVQSATATLNVSAVAPTLTNNVPSTVSVNAGQPATFSVTAGGSLPLTFQWRRGGATIAGATASAYTIPATALGDNSATFDVVVSNVAGTITSALFTLSVTGVVLPPTGLTLPQVFTARAGNIASFTVSPSGTVPFTYQWFRDGQSISGAQAQTFTIASVQLTDNGAQFTVQVTNAGGSTTSSVAVLIVLPRVGLAVIAGNVGGPGFVNGPDLTARFTNVTNLALDNGGNLFFIDGSTIREISAGGIVSTLAGSPLVSGTADGTGGAARFGTPQGLLVDGSGNVLVADTGSHTLRRITAAGVVTTIGGAAGVAGSTDGPAIAARFNGPQGIANDAAGNIYVADTGNHVIRKIDTAGSVTTFAGLAGAPGSADGSGNTARFNAPRNVAVSASGFVYVADSGNNTIRMITSAGAVTTLAGSPSASGTVDGVGAAARFSTPSGIAVDGAGIVYVSDASGLVVRKITAGAGVTTIAGTANAAGSADGTGAAARFLSPIALASDSAGSLFVADRDNFTIRRISTTNVVTTLGGAPVVQGSTDGSAAVSSFNGPVSVAVDRALNVYVADQLNSTIRKISVAGLVTTLAGTAGAPGAADGAGAAARFSSPQGVAIDATGTLYVADKANHTIRKVTPAGVVTTLAGTPGVAGAADGTGGGASFNGPSALAVDAAGNVYVVDDNPTVRRVTASGVVTTLAGAAGRVGAVDGPGAVASFRTLRGIAIDGAGNLYVTDAGNATVRKITSAGVVSTIAGAAGAPGSVDGNGAVARFTTPTGIAIGGFGQLYVADPGTHTIRRIDPAANVSTVAGVADGLRGVLVGDLPGHLDQPTGLAADPNGVLYVTDANGVVRITLQ